MARLGILFPGQGAQGPGMGRALWERFQSVRDLFAEASDALGRDFARLCFASPDEVLRETDQAQPALYLVGYASWRVLADRLGDGQVVAAMAGHSLGEYTALAAANAVTFLAGLHLVAERGRLMRQAGATLPGTMLAVIGLDLERVEDACRWGAEASGDGQVVVVANDNAPGQVVISGTSDAVARVGDRVRELGARRVVPLAVSGAFHSPLMAPVAADLQAAIDRTPIGRAAYPIVANTTARPIQEPGEIRGELAAQLAGRVRWTETIHQLKGTGVERLVEAAPGQVLTGLARRIDSSMPVFSLADGDGLDALMDSR